MVKKTMIAFYSLIGAVTMSLGAEGILWMSPVAKGVGDGSSFKDAAGLASFAELYKGASEIRFEAASYTNGAEIVIASHNGLRLSGGWTSGDARGGESIFERDLTNMDLPYRIFNISASTISMERISVRNGWIKGDGMGIAFTGGCAAAITNCTFYNNGAIVANYGDAYRYGAAIDAMQGGSLDLYECVFTNNQFNGGGDTHVKAHGVAISVRGSVSLSVCKSSFDRNFSLTFHPRAGGGAAIYASSAPSLIVDDCTFTTNATIRNYVGSYDQGPYGGTIRFDSVKSGVISDCTFAGGWNNCHYSSTPYRGFGGLMWFQNSKVAIVRSAIVDAGGGWYADDPEFCSDYSSGSIDVSGGSLFMTNVLHGGAYSGWVLGNSDGGVIEAVNCTFAGARGIGWFNAYGYLQRGAASTASFKNCIFNGNADGDFYIYEGKNPSIVNCFTTEFVEGSTLCKFGDALFGDDGFWHVRSGAGRYSGGFFKGGSWAYDEAGVMSPAIDMGAGEVLAEAQPHGDKINVGYDGGTAAASKTVLGSAPHVVEGELKVFSLGVATYDAAMSRASLKAQLADVAGSVDLYVAWGNADMGDKRNAWGDNVAKVGTFAAWDYALYVLEGSVDTETWYRFFAVDGDGNEAASDARSFTIASRPSVEAVTLNTPVTHIYRESASVDVALNDGGDDAVVRVVYEAMDDDGAGPVTNFYQGGLAVVSGEVSILLNGLTPGVRYTGTLYVENDIGTTTFDLGTWRQIGDDEPLCIYVAPEVKGNGDGRSFAHAKPFSSWKSVLELMTKSGDEIRFTDGVFSYGEELIIDKKQGLVLRGGWTSDTEQGGETIIEGSGDKNNKYRVIKVSGSTTAIEKVTVRNGCAASHGQGIYFTGDGSSAALTNCLFYNNGTIIIGGDLAIYGGAVYADSGSLELNGCVFTNNALNNGEAAHISGSGGAVAVSGASLKVKDCNFTGNFISSNHPRDGGGGAIYATGSSATVEIDNTAFTSNSIHRNWYQSNVTERGFWGGAVYFNSLGQGVITGCDFAYNWNDSHLTGNATNGYGGTLYFRDSKVALVNSSITHGGENGHSDSNNAGKHSSGSIDIYGGTLNMTNVLHGGAARGWAVGNRDGVVEAVNCTFANTKSPGWYMGSGYVQRGATAKATFKNTIFWGNEDGSYILDTSDATPPQFNNCIVDGADNSTNFHNTSSNDPRFANAAEYDFHPIYASPARNKGDNTGFSRAKDRDLDGNKRIIGNNIDIGCYECQKGDGLFIILK